MTGAGLVVPYASARGRLVNEREVGVAVVGTGFGARVHVPALRAAGFTVHALVGRDADKTARRADRLAVPRACASLAEALSHPGVDAVSVATPPHTHAPLAQEALTAGRHVLCEKPFTIDAFEARQLLAAATAAGVVHLVGHEFRWATERAVAARAIADGRIGRPRMATFVSYVPLLADPAARAPDWWFDPARGGGWLGASGSHLVDQVRTWLGEVASVSAGLGITSDRAVEADDSFTVHARLRSGATAVLQQTAGAWGPMAHLTRVAGSHGTLWLDGEDVWVADAYGAHRLEVPAHLVLPPAPATSGDPRHRFTHLELGPYTRLAEAFRDAIAGRQRDEGPEPATFADGLAAMEVLDAVRRSAATGLTAEVPALKET